MTDTRRIHSLLAELGDDSGGDPLGPLKRLFWTELNYDRASDQLSRRGWAGSATEALASDPILFAQGGEDGSFNVVYCQLKSETLALGPQRQVLTTLLRDFPLALFIFSNSGETKWHLVNPLPGPAGSSARPVFRRISVGGTEQLRTASERVSLLDLASIGGAPEHLSALAIKERHDEAFSVEAVQKNFFASFAECYEMLVGDIEEQDEFCEAAPAITQLLLDRLLFLYFVQRKGLLGSSRSFLYDEFKRRLKDDPEGEDYFSEFLIPLFAQLGGEGDRSDIPFLNGGLFEAADLNAPGLKLWNSTFEKLFVELFERFNFTVTEDTPLDVEVAIDPEMLGRIFEGLVLQLEDTPDGDLRKITGSYYTPREVVHWMCRSSLEGFLSRQLKKDGKNRIHKLLGFPSADQLDEGEIEELENLFSEDEVLLLHEQLLDIRVCDPAVGSGAFPVGMLQEIVAAVARLEILIGGPDSIYQRNYIYEKKRHVIEHSLYGVDVQPQAVALCELRLWLSLIVDYEPDVSTDNGMMDIQEVPALPNLGYRIKSADSLIETMLGSDLPHGRLDWHLATPDEISKLQGVKAEFAGTSEPEAKQDLREQIASLETAIARKLLEYRKARLTSYQDSLLGEEGLSKRDRDLREQRASELEILARLEASIEATSLPAAHQAGLPSTDLESFSWSLDFAEVYADKGGFDVVIANPPYVRVHRLPTELKKKLWKAFPTFKAKADLYACFIERATDLVNPHGVVTFICSETWQWLDSYHDLRAHILTVTQLEMLVDLDFKVFAEASVNVSVFQLQRRGTTSKKSSSKMRFARIESVKGLANPKWSQIPLEVFDTTYKNTIDTSWTPERAKIKKSIEKAGEPLGSLLDVKFGLKTGDDGRFVSDTPFGEHSEKLIRGNSVSRYSIEWGGDYVDYRPSAMREHRNTARPGERDRFTQEKVLVRDTSSVLECALDEHGYFAKDVLIVTDPSNEIDLAYVAALLNSDLVRWYYQASFPTVHVQSEELKSLPLPLPRSNKEVAGRIADLGRRRQRSVSGEDSRRIEASINQEVHHLFGMTSEQTDAITREMNGG